MSLLNKIDILYESEDILIINKPVGLMVHSDGRFVGETLVDWILKNRPEIDGVGEEIILNQESKNKNDKEEGEGEDSIVLNQDSGIESEETNLSSEHIVPNSVINRPGIVHRIDRDTSGVLLIAKNQKAFLYFKKQFKNREVRKEYHTFVYGSLNKDFGTIDLPIGRSRSDFRKWSADPHARGEIREANTYYEVIERGEGATFIKALPKTGRTHQIRVHFKAIHHPIVSDPLYARNMPQLLGFERVALHAFSLEVKDMEGKVIVVTAPYPQDFTEALKLFRGQNNPDLSVA